MSVSTNLARSSADDLYVDPLAQGSACQRDIPYLLKLQSNAIRSYAVDPSSSHDDCMNAFADAGIYVVVDLAAPGLTIGTNNPIWNDALYDRYTAVIDSMHNYTNLLGFVIGDNIVQGIGDSDSGPYVKAAVRDMKAYMRQKEYRSIPVGYVNDIFQNTDNIDPLAQSTWDYLECGDVGDRIDFFGANLNTLCGGDSVQLTAIQAVTENIPYRIPFFFASYGCSQSDNIDFSKSSIIFDSYEESAWSGGLAYEYFAQGDGSATGFVNVSGNNVELVSNFRTLSSVIASATVAPSNIANSATFTPSPTTALTYPSGGATNLPPNPRDAVVSSGSTASASSTSSNVSPSATAVSASGAHWGLSPGAKAGIGVGVAIGVIALNAGMFLLWKKRQHKNHEPSQEQQWTKTELAADDVDREARGYGPRMADSEPRAEVEGNSAIPEAAGDKPVFEKPGQGDSAPELLGTPHKELPVHLPLSEKE